MLTKVPTIIPTRMANDSGNCMSAPMEPLDMKGNKEKMVVSEVIMIGISRSCPARDIATIKAIPPRRCTLMVSIFKMESLITIPVITMTPVIDMMSMDMSKTHRMRSTKNTSITISERMMSGCTILSN